MPGPVGSLRRWWGLPRWLVVDLPCRFYLSAEERGGRPVWIYLVGWLAVVAGCSAGGTALGLAQGGAVLDGAFSGARFGLFGVLVWIGYAVVFLLALWFRGESPAAVLNRHLPVATADNRSARHARAAEDAGWRRRGDLLVSRGWLVLLASATAVTGLVALWAHQQATEEDTARSVADMVATTAAGGAVDGAAPTGTGGYWSLADGSRATAYGLIALTVASLLWYVVERRRATSPGRRRG